MRVFKYPLVSCVAIALVLVALPAAALVGSWSTPANLSNTGESASDPQVTVSSTGLATAVWYRYDGTNDIIQSSTSQSGGDWSTPADLSVTGRDAYDPQVTVSSTGLATAVWYRSDGTNDIIQSSTSLNGEAWSTPADLSNTGQNASDPQVTVSSTGLATAVWERSDGTNAIIQSSTSLNGEAWSTPANLSVTGGNAFNPQVTVSSTGLATAVWTRYDGTNFTTQSSTSENGEAWSTPVNVSLIGEYATNPQVTVSSTGLATAVWVGYDGTNNIIQSSTSLNGEAWSTPVNVSLTGGNASDPQVTVSSTGLATAVWSSNDGNRIIKSSTSLNGGAWSTPADLSNTGRNASNPQVTVSSTGLATAVWYRYDGSINFIQSSTSQSGGDWSTPVNVSLTGGSAYDPQVTASSTGLATAVWERYDGTNDIIQSSTLYNQIPTTPTTTPTPPTLAKTGAEVDWLALGSLIAVVAGAGLFAMGRGRRTE